MKFKELVESYSVTESKKIDMSKYEGKGFDKFQMQVIRKGLEQNLDVSKFADTKYNADQMEQICNGLEK